MSATWSIYSPLAPQQMRSLEEACDLAVEDYLEEHPDCDDQCGEVLAGGSIPRPEEVASAYRQHRMALPGPIVDRLKKCRSAMTIDRPGDLDGDPLQVSVLRFLLERAGEALVMLNDYPLQTSEDLLQQIARKEAAQGFAEDEEDDEDEDGDEGPESRPARAGAQGAAEEGGGDDGAARAARMEQLLSAARENPELSIDVVQVLRRTPDLGRRYAALLLEEGAMTDAGAAKALRAPRAEVAAAAEALDRALRGLTS